MSNWVKIKKAKQLRYKLISVLYLLFIALSIINIPIEWLHVNKYIAPLLTETTVVSIDNQDLNAVYESVEQTKKDFYAALGYNVESGTYREPFGYSATDIFFINEERGKGLQQSLNQVAEHADRLGPKQLSEFNELFADDITNGLLDDGDEWIKWKFKHVPASMAETLLNELILRVRLISGDLEFKGGVNNDSKESIVDYATNLDYLVFGDTLKVKTSVENIRAVVSYNTDSAEMSQSKDFFYFIPTTTGNHKLTLQGRTVQEEYTFTVLPAQISNRSQRAFITYFESTPSVLELGTVISGGRASCSCDVEASFRNNKLSFTPTSEGWCKLKIRGANGILLLNDSVYVQPTPAPYFKVKGLLNGDKLPSGDYEVALEAFHPSVGAEYNISSITYEKLGTTSGDVTANASSIDVSNYEGALWIKKVVATSGSQVFESNQSFLITIAP
ncbi:MAG: hypothetical protein CMP53_02940 [Flavobacteriales bacterium]|nr:hypothetical protein [Flavobacteriales bacterium]